MFKKIKHIIKQQKKEVCEKTDIKNLPRRVIIETTNKCNLNCPFCMVGMQNELLEKHGNTAHNLMSREQGVMTEKTFRSVLKNLIDFGIEKAYLHFQGEPFLNKLTPRFAKDLIDVGIKVSVFTNGQLFTDKLIQDIANVEIELIRFSVDGASEETYRVNRVGGKFAPVYENMKKVVEAHRGKTTRIEWQFLALRNNEHEIETARKMARDIGINFFVKGLRETDPELAPKNPEYRSSYLQKPCTDIYLQLGIYWNGDVVPCCYDVDGKEIMGNLHDDTLEDIWNENKYRLFRKRVDNILSCDEDEPAICKNCLRWK